MTDTGHGPARVLGRAPGRVNLIGDHTDTTGGLVLPLAIDRYTEIIGRPTPGRVRLRSHALEGTIDWAWSEIGPTATSAIDREITGPEWSRYPRAVAHEFADLLDPEQTGFDAIVASTVPVGAGLSSSAALEVAVACALMNTTPPATPETDAAAAAAGGAPMDLDAVDLARRCQRAEHRASGVPCGVMDQLVIVDAHEDAALLIDTTSLDRHVVALPDDVEIVVSFVAPRTLAASGYAERTRELATVARELGDLRDRDPREADGLLDPTLVRRARHVITENRRVRDVATALAVGDLEEVGRLMIASHRSLRDDLEVSTPAVDERVARWSATPGVFGARLTGGGFGGCVVALTRPGVIPSDEHTWTVRAVAGALRTPRRR